MANALTNTSRTAWSIPKVPRRIGWLIGLVIPLAATMAILTHRLHSIPAGNWSWAIRWEFLALTLLLSPVNWGLEIRKWAELLPHGSIARRRREVLYGVAWSMIGPLRMGAIVGRVAATRKNERNQAVRAFATASAAQWWCTISGAGLALLLAGMPRLGIPVLVASGMSLALYFGWSPGLWKIIRKFRLTDDWRLTRRIPTARRSTVLKLSISRYLVMLMQFAIVLNAFHHLKAAPWLERLPDQVGGGAITWGLTSLAPVPMLGDLGLREAAALVALPAMHPADTTAIIGAMLSLWVANLLLPALLGLHLQNRYMRSNRRSAKLPS